MTTTPFEIAKQFTEQYRRLSPEGTRALSLIMEPLKLAKGKLFVKEGEVADISASYIDDSVIADEEKYLKEYINQKDKLYRKLRARNQ